MPSVVLLVTDRRALDLDRVRRVATERGWDIALETVDGRAAPPDDRNWLPGVLRLRVTAREGSSPPNAGIILALSPGLALDERRHRPYPPRI